MTGKLGIIGQGLPVRLPAIAGAIWRCQVDGMALKRPAWLGKLIEVSVSAA
jgi:hypothetical protein